MLVNRDIVLAEFRRRLIKVHERMKHNAGNHMRDVSFKVEEWVMVKLHPHCQISVAGSSFSKLAKCYYDPFQIFEQGGHVAYKFQLLEGSHIHPFFHCSMPKPFHQANPTTNLPLALPSEALKNQPIISPLVVLNTHWTSS